MIEVNNDSNVFNVVVAYDNLRAGQRAMRTLTSLVDQFRGTRVEMRPQLWRFDLLDEPQCFRAALHDAIRADMLIVSTTSNNEPMNRAVTRVAERAMTGKPVITEGMMNQVEVIIRAYDPCLSCATHAMGRMPLMVELFDADGVRLDHRLKAGQPTVVSGAR